MPARRGLPRRLRLLGLVAAVLAAHAWVIRPSSHSAGRLPARAPVVQVLALAPAPAPPQPAPPTPAPQPARPATPVPMPDTGTDAAPATEPLSADLPLDALAGRAPPEAVAGTVVTPADIGTPAEEPTPRELAATAEDGGRPPLYTTRPPGNAFRLVYRLERGDDAGHALLAFEPLPDGAYRARFISQLRPAEGGPERGLHDWESRGGFDAAGMAPKRMVERVRGREVRAVNFQRDKGLISFSGSTTALTLFAGAQDRLSLVLQLMAIAEGQPDGLAPGQRLRLQVAGSRGLAAEWVFEVVDRPLLEPSGRPLPTVRLVREPQAPYDQRVEVWLAAEAGHLPVGLRFTTVPGRASEAYWLQGALPEPPRGSP